MAAVVPFLILLFVIGGIWTWVHQNRVKRERQEALALWALDQGWDYSMGEDSQLESRVVQFSCFQQGSNRYGYNILRGMQHDRELVALDYHYETYSTDSKGRRTTHHHHFSAVILDTGLKLKPLAIRAENWFDKVTEFLGWDDIDFESAEFSRAFHVKCADKRHAFDLIPQDTMEFLLESPRFSIELLTPCILVRRSKTFKPEEFEQALRLAHGFIDRIPSDIRAALQINSA